MKIAVIGSSMIDLIAYTDAIPKAGETLEAQAFKMGCGGKGANQAVAAALLGSEVMMMARVGDDTFADNTIANFQAYGVDTELVEKVSGAASGVASIWVDRASQNRILIIPGANKHLLPADLDAAADRLKGCKLIVLQLEIPLETVYRAIDFGSRHGIAVILNPAPATTALDLNHISNCDFLVPNETELEILSGMPVGTEEQIHAAARTLLDTGLKNLIVTLGDRGALWLRADASTRFPAPAVKAVDTTGAGDAFIGCFAHNYGRDGDIHKAITQAVRYASHSVTDRGTQTAFATAEAFGLLGGHSTAKPCAKATPAF